MQYLAWGDVRIPVCLVTGFSYIKRARIVEHARGFASPRGFEAAEISVRVAADRASAVAYGLDFLRVAELIDGLSASRDGTQGPVTLGGHPIYPEIEFSVTSVTRTHQTDLTGSGWTALEADITLSGVACVKEAARDRMLIVDNGRVTPVPKTTITCRGESLEIKDTAGVAVFTTTPKGLQLEILVGQDTVRPERESFLTTLIGSAATVTCELPQGTTVYTVVQASLVEGALAIYGSVLPEAAGRAVTRTYVDTDLREVLSDICGMMGVSADIQVSGRVGYYLMRGTPVLALEELQRSAGFIVSIQGNRLACVWVPTTLTPVARLDGLVVTGDSLSERVGGVIWSDGLHRAEATAGAGEIVEVAAAFSSEEAGAYAERCLAYQRYSRGLIVVTGALDGAVCTHSPVSIPLEGREVAALVDSPLFDWVAGQMSLECREVA